MANRSAVWGRIRYIAFLGLFVSLLATYWVFTNQVPLDSGDAQMFTYPHRSYAVIFAMLSAMLFCLYFYSRLRESRISEPLARS